MHTIKYNFHPFHLIINVLYVLSYILIRNDTVKHMLHKCIYSICNLLFFFHKLHVKFHLKLLTDTTASSMLTLEKNTKTNVGSS